MKDAFELDKMFFIVNAIDLATTEEEQEDVKAMYVQSYNALAFVSRVSMAYQA